MIIPRILFVTGGAGFIGSALVRFLLKNTNYTVVNIDKLTYAGNLASLNEVLPSSRYYFEKVDICDKAAIAALFDKYLPSGIFHLAAESHVDRSISGSEVFIQTNILGTYNLLENTRNYLLNNLDKTNHEHQKIISQFKFIHISTDEVFGSLGEDGCFSEDTCYDPRSPYSASKASSDLLVKSWQHTYQLPLIITNCSNNYGPYHFPEKLIPLVINNAIKGKSLPIYGDGRNIRDWLYVDDHVRALVTVYEKARVGESYCIGGHNERSNLQVVQTVCHILDELKPRIDGKSYKELISYVADRKGHDYRYAIDPSKIESELGFKAEYTFESGIRSTVEWFLNNQEWVSQVESGEYLKWIDENYMNRSS